ncbi:pyruvoyl-dependent arginine decarboxylase [Candidatus Gracilibacteria bacterium]|nr:pyruvoyl-dependent arginine decarboxylase [Candidatus Gracilibacteria bacterium]
MKKNQIRGGLAPLSPGGMILGNRIPRDYFITKGTGESDITIHAGSYHLALKTAGIHRANIMTYSSILPSIAQEITQPKNYNHGEVMESIMAVAHGENGQRVSAGIIFGRLYDKKTGKKFGGLVCEHNGSYPLVELKNLLRASINELYINGFDKKYDLKQIRLITETFVPTKKHGTALVALCFTNYIFPIIT